MTDATFTTLRVATDARRVTTITLDRPEVHNAFNETLIAELRQVFEQIRGEVDAGNGPRVVVITGAGKSFCAGADLNWMQKQKDYTLDENLADAEEAAGMFFDLYSLPCATIARVNGAAMGGGTGLASACDISIAVESAKFSLSEVKLGLAPAVISPYVLKRIGERHAREYFLTGERFDAKRAAEIGLVQHIVPDADLDAAIDAKIGVLLTSGPAAVRAAKQLIADVANRRPEDVGELTAGVIARLRISPEGQEGIRAFLEKRKPDFAG